MRISNKQQAISSKKQNGFTLVETVVALLIFAILMTIVGSAFVNALNLQRRAFNIQRAVENSNFIVESMAKEIRVSQINGPDSGCPASPGSSLSINHPVNGSVTYGLSGTSIIRNGNVINSNDVEFTSLKFCVSGTPANDQRQPKVTIIAGIKSLDTSQQAVINVQTTVSQRFLSN